MKRRHLPALSLVALVALALTSAPAFAEEPLAPLPAPEATPPEPPRAPAAARADAPLVPPLPSAREDGGTPATSAPDTPRRRGNPRNALTVPLVALFNSGFALEYERFFAPPHFSLVTAAGLRSSGGRTLDVLEASFGLEGRLWIWGKGPFSRYDGRAMVGPYLGLRFDYGASRVWTESGRGLGSAVRFGEALTFGVRLTVARHVHVTPSVGFGVRTEIDPSGRLAPLTSFEALRMGLAVGALF